MARLDHYLNLYAQACQQQQAYDPFSTEFRMLELEKAELNERIELLQSK